MTNKKKLAAPDKSNALVLNSPNKEPAKEPRLKIVQKKGQTTHRAYADAALSPAYTGSIVAREFTTILKGQIGPNEAVDFFNDAVATVKSGDMSGVEAMLVAQSVTLNAIFCDMAYRGSAKMKDSIAGAELMFRMAFKAQAQCRTTLEALAEIKSPRQATFVRQQNVANQQQVNNGAGPPMKDIRTQETENLNMTNQLLEQHHGERLDTRAQGTPGGADPHMATVEAINRPQD